MCTLTTRTMLAGIFTALLAGSLAGCGGSAPLRANMAPMDFSGVEPVENSPFIRDRTGALTEADLIRMIETPVFLADETRLGIVPVAVAYEADDVIPLVAVPEVLAGALDDTGFFSVTSEVSTDWPSDRSVAGLRELAARYRTRYLLLYRHRFVERTRANGWAATYAALITIPFMPGQTLETAGVMEATLFDVRTGSLLFTVYERVYAESDSNVWANDRKLTEMREQLVNEGADRLADKVVDQIHRLVAARPVRTDSLVGSVEGSF